MPQLAPDAEQAIGHVGHRDAESLRQLGVRWTGVVEVVLLEQGVVTRFSRLRAGVAQTPQRGGEDPARPLLFEQRLRRFDGVGDALQFLPRVLEVE